MNASIIKHWVNNDQVPSNLYMLLGRPLFDDDRGALLAAAEAANAELLNYQNATAKQARVVQLFQVLGRFQAALESPELLKQHDRGLVEELRGRCGAVFGADSRRWQQPQVHKWLLQENVHPSSLTRVLTELTRPAAAPAGAVQAGSLPAAATAAATAAPRVFGPAPAAQSTFDKRTYDMMGGAPALESAYSDLDSSTVDVEELAGAITAVPKRAPVQRQRGPAAKPRREAQPQPQVKQRPVSAEAMDSSATGRDKSLQIHALLGAGALGVVVLLGFLGWWLMSGSSSPEIVPVTDKDVAAKVHEPPVGVPGPAVDNAVVPAPPPEPPPINIPHMTNGAVRLGDPTVAVQVARLGAAWQLPAKTYELRLAAGQYSIEASSGDFHPMLVIHDKDGKQLAFDDDDGKGLDSRVQFHVATAQTLKIHVAAVLGSGAFTLAIKPAR